MKISFSRHVAALLVAACCSGAALGATTGDEPNDPVQLSGNTFLYDSNNYTTTQYPTMAPWCFPDGNFTFKNDVWVCWTANCTGLVTVSLCGGGGVPDGTRAAMWVGCADPTQNPVFQEPFCCSDNACGKDALIHCEVVCGQQYLFRFGLDPGTQAVVRNITFTCEGQPCAGGGGADCSSCCARPPMITNFAAPSLVGTSWEDLSTEYVVHCFDVTQFGSQLPGPYLAPVYEHPTWTRANLGSVFGVTLDRNGNIYVAHTGIYNADYVGTVGGGGAGAIYRLDSASGLPTLFCKLPNFDPCAPGTTCAPGLGNLTYSCAHDCIYASNIEDGRIYRISMTGAKLEAYNFGAQAIQSANPDPNDAVGPAPLGKRVWGVGVAGDRLYFGVWREDTAAPSAAASNEVWSIPLTPVTGAFAGAVPTLEVTVPPLAGNIYSNPVADIAFDANCCMYLAERSVNGPDFSNAHASRLLKYCKDATGRYVPSGQTFQSGTACCGGGLVNSTAGGVGVDQGANGLVWSTSDAINFNPTYYGIVGLPQTGGVNSQGLWVDMNADIMAVDKYDVGSVEVACRVTDTCRATITATCHLGPDGLPDGQYELSISFHNGMESAAADLLLLPDLGTFVHLTPPLQPGEDRKVVVVTSQFTPGIHTMDIGLFNSACAGCHCCGVLGVEFEIPDCYCMILEEMHVTCHDDRDPNTWWYDVSFVLRNISPYVARHLFIVPSGGVTTAPQYVQLPFVAPGQTVPIAFTIKFPGPPPAGPDGLWHTTISLSLFQFNFNLCCKKFIDFSGPVNCSSGILGDLNNDGVVNGADLGIAMGDWGVVPVGGCLSDLNGDGVVNGADIGILLANWHP